MRNSECKYKPEGSCVSTLATEQLSSTFSSPATNKNMQSTDEVIHVTYTQFQSNIHFNIKLTERNFNNIDGKK